MKENLKPCVYKLSNHNVAIQSFLLSRDVRMIAEQSETSIHDEQKTLRISGLKRMSVMRSISEWVAMNSRRL